MNDSADIQTASEKLQLALEKLEEAVSPLLSELGQLKAKSAESESFTQDRSRLAAELDSTKADQEKLESEHKELTEKLQVREGQFKSLAHETHLELDRVIRHVEGALERLPS